MDILRALLFTVSMTGYVLWYRSRFGIRMEFGPGIFCAMTSVFLLVAGLFNLLAVAAALLFFGGLVLFIKNLISLRKYREGLAKKEFVRFACFLAAGLYFAVLLYGVMINEYDNFSHYLIVVNDMLRANALPSFKSINIMFQSYPVGSSLFIYYACRVIGSIEHWALWANLLINLSGLLSITAFIEKKKSSYIGFAAFCLYLFLWRADFNSLLVDTILGSASITAFAVMYYYRDNKRLLVPLLSVLLSFVIMIKNSGMFFVFICLVFLFYMNRKNTKKELMHTVGIPTAVSFGLMLIWLRHTDMMFFNAAGSKHSISLSRYIWMFREKGFGTLAVVLRRVLIDGLMVHNAMSLVISLSIALVFLLLFFLYKDQRKLILRTAAAVFALIFSYLLALCAAYMVSSPLEETTSLGGYVRYAGTMLLFVMGIVLIFVICLNEQSDGRSGGKALMLAALLVFALPVIPNLGKFNSLYDRGYHHALYEDTDRYLLQQAINKYSLPEGAEYVVYTEKDRDYLMHVCRNDFWVAEPLTIDNKGIGNLESTLEGKDYFVILQDNEYIRAALEAAGYDIDLSAAPLAIKLN